MKRFNGNSLETDIALADDFHENTLVPLAKDMPATIANMRAVVALYAAGVQFTMRIPLEYFYEMRNCHDSVIDSFLSFRKTRPLCKPTEIANNLTESYPTYAFLHIRRGDTVSQCDSSPNKIGLHVNCWINSGGNFNNSKSHIAAVFFCTDEVDISYSEAVMKEVSKFVENVVHVESMSTKALISNGVPREHVDNYLLYEVCEAVKLNKKV